MNLIVGKTQAGGQAAVAEKSPPCRALRALMDWQAEQYRQAVVENRWFMSQKLNRYITWKEAELDFCEHDTYGCAQEWRAEYCGNQCVERSRCRLATLFLKKDQPVAA